VTNAAPAFSWRTAAVAVYGPSVLFSVGEGSILPMIPHVAEGLGATIAVAGFIAALETVGELIGSLPTGWLIPRIGERNTMFIATGVGFAGAMASYFAPNPMVLGLGILLIGIAAAIFQLARQALLTTAVPLEFRARAMSTLGGMFRLGITIGPFLMAALLGFGLGPDFSFVVQLVVLVLIVVLLLSVRDPERALQPRRELPDEVAEELIADPIDVHPRTGMITTARRRWRVLGTVGVGSAALAALRQSRQMILPLWAVAIALDPDATAVIIGIAALVDFALFYTGGLVMDRFGRMWVVMPVMIGLAAGHLLLAVTGLLPGQVVWFAAVAIFLALANGLGSGVVMTLAADLADRDNPAPFLALWRLMTSAGGAAAPLIVSGVTALASLPVAAVVIGAIGLGGAWLMGATLPGYDPRVREGGIAAR